MPFDVSCFQPRSVDIRMLNISSGALSQDLFGWEKKIKMQFPDKETKQKSYSAQVPSILGVLSSHWTRKKKHNFIFDYAQQSSVCCSL